MIEFRLLGSVDLKGTEGALRSVLAQPKRVALLAYLAVARPNGYHRRDKLLGLFWPESDQVRGRGALRKALYFLRQSLGDDVIVSRGDEEIGLAEGALWCDAVAFEAALEAGQPDEALDLYRGDLLEGFFISETPEFERWLEVERERLRRRAAQAAWALADGEETAGNGPAAEKWARRALTFFPNDESAFRRLLELLDRLGNRTGAIEEYEAFARHSQEEYEAQPSPETQALIAAIRQRVASELDAAVSGAPATEPPERSASAGESVDAAGAAARPEPVVEPAGPRRRTGRGRIRGTVAAAMMILTLVAAAVIVPRLMGPDSQSPSASSDAISSTRVAVLPFQVQGSPEAAYLGEGVMDLLSEAVDGLGELRRVDPFALMGRIRRQDVEPLDPDKARELARQFGAGHYVLGSVVELGDEIGLSASLYDLTGGFEPAANASAQGRPEELPELVRQLVLGLLAEVPVGSGARLERIATVEASNWTALRAYLEGEALMRRGEFNAASQAFSATLEADSTFVLAWYRLGMAQIWGPGDGVKSIDMAMRYRERLSARDRLLVETAAAWLHGQGERAERLAREVVGRFPDHTEGWYWLGESRWWYQWQVGWPLAQAEQAFRRALALDPSIPEAAFHAAWIARNDRRWAEAEELLDRDPWRSGSSWWVLNMRAGLAFGSGNRVAQRNIIRELESARDGERLIAGYGLAVVDSLRATERVWKGLVEADRSERASAQVHLAQLEVARGRWRQARVELERAAEFRPAVAFAIGAWLAAMPFLQRPEGELAALRDSLRDWQPPDPGAWGEVAHASIPHELLPWIKQYALGLLRARLQDTESAEQWARELEEAVEPPDSAALRRDLALEVRALAAYEAGRPAEALALLEESRMAVTYWRDAFSPLYRRPSSVFLRAELLQQLNRGEEALAWYTSFLDWPGYVFLSPACLGMAEIYESWGELDKAVEYYRRFVARWQDADPEYQPLVADVRARIARLTGDRSAVATGDTSK